MPHSFIMKTTTGFSWESSGDKEALDWMLNPIIRSAADLLVSEFYLPNNYLVYLS